jgi:hypothetical protein
VASGDIRPFDLTFATRVNGSVGTVGSRTGVLSATCPWAQLDYALEVTQAFGGGGFVVWVAGNRVEGGAVVGAAFERPADDVAGAETDGESKGEDDAAEEDSEGEFDDGTADLEVVKNHGGGENEDEPLDAKGEEAGVLELGVDGADEDGALEKAGDEGSGDEQEDGSDGVGEIGKDEDGDRRTAGVGGVEGGEADETADEDAGPEDDAGEELGGAVRGRPIGDRGGGVTGEALVELCGDQRAAQEGGQTGADGRHYDDGEEKGEQAGKKAGEFYEDLLCGLPKGEFDLLPHERVSLRVLLAVCFLQMLPPVARG